MALHTRTFAKKVAALVALAASVTLLNVSTHEAAVAAPVLPDCGPTVLKADGTPWTCTFVDQFSARNLDPSKWTPQLTANSGYGSGECFVDAPGNVAVANGELRLTLQKLKRSVLCADPAGSFRTQFTSGMVTSNGKFSQAFGRVEFRAKFPGGTKPGLQGSLWLWPQTLDPVSYPFSGEIDVAEWYSHYPDRVIPYVHYWYDYQDANSTNNYCMVANAADWHTYTLEWTRDAIEIKYDGTTCLRTTAWASYRDAGYAPFDKPFMLAMTQLMGVGANKASATNPPVYPATTSIDYVKVWS